MGTPGWSTACSWAPQTARPVQGGVPGSEHGSASAPLVVIAAVMVLVFAHGLAPRGHRREHRGAARPLPSRPGRAPRCVGACLCRRLRRPASLSLPGCPILTATGGLLFGWLVGGAAAVVGATIGRHHPVPDRAVGGRRNAERAGRTLARQAAPGLQGGRAELSAVPAPCSGLSLLVCQYRAGRPRRSPQDLRDRDVFRYHARPPSPLRRRGPASTASSWRRRPSTRNAWPRAVRQPASSPSMQARSSPGSCCWRCCF